jgi:hypothetical protein
MTQLERDEFLLREKSEHERSHDTRPFVPWVADTLGLPASTVRHRIRRAEAIDPDVRAVIRGIPRIANSWVELDALAGVFPTQQRAAVDLVLNGQAINVRAAARLILVREADRRRQASPKGFWAALRTLWRRLAEQVLPQRVASSLFPPAG